MLALLPGHHGRVSADRKGGERGHHPADEEAHRDDREERRDRWHAARRRNCSIKLGESSPVFRRQEKWHHDSHRREQERQGREEHERCSGQQHGMCG
jgi:hypothetical protein